MSEVVLLRGPQSKLSLSLPQRRTVADASCLHRQLPVRELGARVGRGWQTFSVRDQIVTILGSVGPVGLGLMFFVFKAYS